MIEKQMVKLQNALVASAVFTSAIALLYGFTAVIARSTVSLKSPEQRHWGGGMTGRRGTSVASDAESMPGGDLRHGTYDAYREGRGFGLTQSPAGSPVPTVGTGRG